MLEPALISVAQYGSASRKLGFPKELRNLKSIKWERHVPVYKQSNSGACVGYAALGALGTGSLYDTLKANDKLPNFSEELAIEIYSKATALDEYPGQYPEQDTGSSGLAAAKALRAMGLIESYRRYSSFSAALLVLQIAPVISGINWYKNFAEPTPEGECLILPNTSPLGGHEIVVDELDVENQRVWFTNSWGPDWNINGRGWFSYLTWRQLLHEKGDVIKLIPIK